MPTWKKDRQQRSLRNPGKLCFFQYTHLLLKSASIFFHSSVMGMAARVQVQVSLRAS
ncbi:MAG: hypothetical protein LBT21_00670 [Oscillospiraceae bacterium]|nr:hypothetical protein [Oscillospiraceae bacterium]